MLTKIWLSETELAIVLAALRLAQHHHTSLTELFPDHFGIVGDQAQVAAFEQGSALFIDNLCERFNIGSRSDVSEDERVAYVAAAQAEYAEEGQIEIDDDAEVSRPDPEDVALGVGLGVAEEEAHQGAYVQAWVWVDQSSIGA